MPKKAVCQKRPETVVAQAVTKTMMISHLWQQQWNDKCRGGYDTNARQCVSFRQLPPGWLWKHLCPQLARIWKQHVDNCYRPLKVKGFPPLLWITSTNRFINQALRIYLPRYLFWIYSPAPCQYYILLLLLLHGMFTSGDEVWRLSRAADYIR